MAGIGERMEGAGEIVFAPDGTPLSMDGGPPPDAETLARLRRMWRAFRAGGAELDAWLDGADAAA